MSKAIKTFASPVTDLFAPSPPKPKPPPDISSQAEEDARNAEAEDERKKRRRARAARVFTGPGGAAVSDKSLGRANLLGS